MIRVGLVAAAALVRAGLQQLIEAQQRFEFVIAAASLAQLRGALVERADGHADVVIVDWPADEDVAPLRTLLESGQKVVVLSDGDAAALLPLAAAGAACLPAAAHDTEIVAAVEAAAAGLSALRGELIDDLLHRPPGWRERRAVERIEPLTQRECEVLRLLAEGLGNKRIAASLGISEHTAKAHVGRVLGKLNASTRAAAVAIGLLQGLIKSGD